MTERWVTLSDLHLNEEGYNDFDAGKFVERYEDSDIEGIAYLGDAVSRPDLHDDLKNDDRQWADYVNTYHGFMKQLNEIGDSLDVDIYFGKGNHDPDPDAQPNKEAIDTMQRVHEDVARADFAANIEDHAAAEGTNVPDDPYSELDRIFNPEDGEAFKYNRRDSVESLYELEHFQEGVEREDDTVRGYLLDQFDNLKDAENSVIETPEHNIVFGSSFMDREFNPDEEQTGDLYEMEEFEEIAEMLDTEPFYESLKRKGGLFGVIGDTVSSFANTVESGANVLANAREYLTGEYEPEESEDTDDEIEEPEWELSEDFSFKDIPYEEANSEQKRYINRMSMMSSLVEGLDKPIVVMDHGLPNLSDTEAEFDLYDGAHKGSMVWRELMEENPDKIGTFVGGHFHGMGYKEVNFPLERGETEQDIINTSEVYSELEITDGRIDDTGAGYNWFDANGSIATSFLERPESERSFEEIFGISEERVRGIAEAQDKYYNMMNQVESLLESGQTEDAKEMVERVRN